MAQIIKIDGHDVNNNKLCIGDIFAEEGHVYVVVGETKRIVYFSNSTLFLNNLKNGSIKTSKDIRKYAWGIHKSNTFKTTIIGTDFIEEPGKTQLIEFHNKILEFYDKE